jgi:hypothetical protein
MDKVKTRARFKDENLEKQFEKDGYVLIRNWVSDEQVNKMRQVFKDRYKAPDFSTNIWNTLIMADESVRREVSDRLLQQLSPSIDKYFYDYMETFAYFLTKPVDEAPREVALHSDSSAVNEEKYEYLAIWLPLVDVDKNNGCMYIIPGSQKLFTYEQPFAIDWPYPDLAKPLKKYAIDLPMKAGDLLIFSGKTLHGSYPNRSKDARPVVGSGIIHPETEMLYFYYDQEKNMVKVYEVDPWFYFRNEYNEPIGKYTFKKSYPFAPPEISQTEIKSFFLENPVKTTNSPWGFLSRFGINV